MNVTHRIIVGLCALFILACAFGGLAHSQEQAPAKLYPPIQYTVVLTPEQAQTLMSIFPTAEMPQTHWAPTEQAIENQIVDQNKKAKDAQEKADAAAADLAAKDKKK